MNLKLKINEYSSYMRLVLICQRVFTKHRLWNDQEFHNYSKLYIVLIRLYICCVRKDKHKRLRSYFLLKTVLELDFTSVYITLKLVWLKSFQYTMLLINICIALVTNTENIFQKVLIVKSTKTHWRKWWEAVARINWEHWTTQKQCWQMKLIWSFVMH